MFDAQKWLEDHYGSEFYMGRDGWVNSLCPFDDHNDSSPSFGVNQDKGIFKCFGCGRSGNFFAMLQELKGVPFAQAMAIIAESCDIDLGNFDSFQYKAERFKKMVEKEDSGYNRNHRLVEKAVRKIKTTMRKDFDKADMLFKQLDEYRENEQYDKIKEMTNG